MPKQKLSEEEKTKNRIERETAKYMENVKTFISSANNGMIPPEYECSLRMLEAYYKQFLVFTAEIDKLDSYIVNTRYGLAPNALLKARDTTVQKLDMILKALGCTFKTQVSMKLVDTKPVEESPLEKLMKGELEVR